MPLDRHTISASLSGSMTCIGSDVRHELGIDAADQVGVQISDLQKVVDKDHGTQQHPR